MYATQQQKKKAAETFSRGSRIGALASANWRLNETLIRPVESGQDMASYWLACGCTWCYPAKEPMSLWLERGCFGTFHAMLVWGSGLGS